MRQEVAERRQRDEDERRTAVEGANKMKFEQVYITSSGRKKNAASQ